ncbi:MAG: hypothetical protein ACPLRM_07680, partial [Anaerolineae bacterium]
MSDERNERQNMFRRLRADAATLAAVQNARVLVEKKKEPVIVTEFFSVSEQLPAEGSIQKKEPRYEYRPVRNRHGTVIDWERHLLGWDVTYIKELQDVVIGWDLLLDPGVARAATGRVLPAYMEVAEATQASGVTSVISTVVGNSNLFFRAFKDVWVATGAGSYTYGGDENLNDVKKRAQFWKEQGIYAKYTLREIAFINKVVLPAVLAVRVGQGVGGAALIAVGAAALFAAPFLPVMGVTLGTAALVTGAKAWLIKHGGQGIAPLLSQDWFSAG